jgi:hypothetical protein
MNKIEATCDVAMENCTDTQQQEALGFPDPCDDMSLPHSLDTELMDESSFWSKWTGEPTLWEGADADAFWADMDVFTKHSIRGFQMKP